MREEDAPAHVVEAFLTAMGRGDPVEARSLWSDDAVWHVTGTHQLAGDYTADRYFEMLARWHASYPQYRPAIREVRTYGPEGAVAYLESTGGMAPGSASGLMVYRVVEGRIREGWAVPTFASGAYAF